MKVFITGASGFIGKQTTKELIKNGYSVLGLARSEASADVLKEMGAEVVKGSLQDTDVLVESSKACDGVIHLGFIHDFANFPNSIRVDREAITAMCDALKGTNKFFIGTSGTLYLTGHENADEDTDLSGHENQMMERYKNGQLVLSYADKGVVANSVRFAPTVHGEGDHGFIPIIFKQAKAHGVAAYPGDGSNVWPAVHKDDIAVMHRLIIEKGINGKILHGVAETVSTKDITKAMAEKGNLKHESVPSEKLVEFYGPFFGMVFNMNNPVSSEKTKSLLGWNPTKQGLVKDIIQYY